MTACPIPRQASTHDVPHTHVGDMQRERFTIDLDGCNVFIVALAINEFDRQKPIGMRFEQWPPAVQAIFEKEIEAWQKRNAGIAIRAYTVSVIDETFTLALHWRPKQ